MRRRSAADFRVVGVETGQEISDVMFERSATQEIPVRFGGDGKTIRHIDSFGSQLTIEFTERSILAADECHVVDADLIKPADISVLL